MSKLYRSGIVISGDARGGVRVLRLTQAELKKLRSEMNRGSAHAKQYSAHMRGMSNSMTSLRGILGQLAPVMGAFSAGLAARSIIDASLAMDGYDRALRAVLGSAEASARELAFVKSEADRVGVAFRPLVSEYAKLAASARNTALEGQGVRDVFSAIVEVSRVLNLSSENTRGAIFALQQMMSKGKISAEELRRQLGERVPGSFKAMADAVGVTTRELDRMLKAGELVSEEVLPKFAIELQKMAEAGLEFAQKAPAAEFARLGNAVFDMNVAIGKSGLPILAEGAKVLTAAIRGATPHMDLFLRLLLGAGAARLLGPMLLKVAASMSVLSLASAKGGASLLALTARANVAAGAMTALNRSMKLVGGPGGVAILAATGIWALVSSQKALREETERATKSLQAQIDEIPVLGKGALNQLIGDIGEQSARDIEELEKLESKVESLRGSLTLALPHIAADFERSEKRIEFLRMRLDDLAGASAFAGVALSRIGGDADAMEQRARELDEAVKALATSLDKKADGLKSTRDALIREAEAMLQNGKLTDAHRQKIQDSIKNLKDAIQANEDATAAQKAYTAALKSGTGTWSAYLKAIDPVTAATFDYNRKAQDLVAVQSELGLESDQLNEVLNWLRMTYVDLLSEEEKLAISNEVLVKGAQEKITELNRENEALKLAITRNIDLAVAEAMLAGAKQETIDELRKAIELNQQLTKEYGKQEKVVDEMATITKRAVKRMDDAFQQFWRNLLGGGKSVFDTLKDLALDTVAEIIHALTTKRFVAAISSSISAGTAGASSGQQFVQAGSQFFGGGGGGGSGTTGALAQFYQLFSGNGIGNFFAGLPTYLGGGGTVGGLGYLTGAEYSASGGAGGMFVGAGEYSSGAYGIAGVLGGLLGDKVFGGQGGIGGSLGATLGMAIGGPIGAAIGAALGGFVGGLFKDRDPRLSLSGNPTGEGQVTQTAFGDLRGFNGAGGVGFFVGAEDDFANQVRVALETFDQTIADFLSDNQIEAITNALGNWSITLEGDALTIENILNSRMGTILSTFSQDIQDFVNDAEGIQAQVERLAQALNVEALLAAAPELFEGRTFRDFIAVAEAMQVEGENLADTFNRLMQEVVAIAAAVELIRGFADSNLAADFEALTAGQNLSLMDVTQNLGTEIRAMQADFDGSAESVARLAQLTAARYESEIALLVQFQEAVNQVKGTFTGLREQIQRDLFGDEAFYNQIKSRAEGLADDLQTMTDPAQIAATIAEIERLTNQAYGLLTEEQRQLMGPEFLEFINGIQDDGVRLLGQSRENFLSESEELRTIVREMADTLGDPLAIAASAHEGAADALLGAAEDLSDAADRLNPPSGAVPPDRSVDEPYRIPSPVYHDPHASVVDSQVIATVVANAVVGANTQVSGAVVQAIRDGFANVTINVQMPRASIVNA